MLDHRLSSRALAAVQTRRTFPTVGTQLVQRLVQRGLVGRALGADRPVRAPLPLRLVNRVPAVQTLPAWLVGVGLRPEHVVEVSAEQEARRMIPVVRAGQGALVTELDRSTGTEVRRVVGCGGSRRA